MIYASVQISTVSTVLWLAIIKDCSIGKRLCSLKRFCLKLLLFHLRMNIKCTEQGALETAQDLRISRLQCLSLQNATCTQALRCFWHMARDGLCRVCLNSHFFAIIISIVERWRLLFTEMLNLLSANYFRVRDLHWLTRGGLLGIWWVLLSSWVALRWNLCWGWLKFRDCHFFSSLLAIKLVLTDWCI